MSQKDLHVELLVRIGPDIIQTMFNTSRLTLDPHEYPTFENIKTALIDHYGVNLESKRRVSSSLVIDKILLMIRQDIWGYSKKFYALTNDDVDYNAAILRWYIDSQKETISTCICHQCSQFKWGLEMTVFVRNKKPRIWRKAGGWDVIFGAEERRAQDAAKLGCENKKRKPLVDGTDLQAHPYKSSLATAYESDTSSDVTDDNAAQEEDWNNGVTDEEGAEGGVTDDDVTSDDTTSEGSTDEYETDEDATEEDTTDGDATDEDAADCVLSRPCASVSART